MSRQHTPTPWYEAPGNFIVADPKDGDVTSGRIVAEVPCQSGNPADVAFIVEAANAYAALRTALANAVECLEYVDHAYPGKVGGGFVRFQRIREAKEVLGKP